MRYSALPAALTQSTDRALAPQKKQPPPHQSIHTFSPRGENYANKQSNHASSHDPYQPYQFLISNYTQHSSRVTSFTPSQELPYLDPKIDIVFKMLFSNENHGKILAGFIAAVLNKTVTEATVLNPSIPRNLPSDKEIFLDISAQLDTGENVDVEMQMTYHHFFPERCLYYWARLHAKQLQRGKANYENLRATHSIIVLNFEMLSDPILANQYHSVVEALVRGCAEPFSPHFRVHTIELPKLARQKNVNLAKDAVSQWGHFMLNPTAETWEKLSQFAPVFKEVQKAMATNLQINELDT